MVLNYNPIVIEGNSLNILPNLQSYVSELNPISLTFIDPPFNQGKQYESIDDELPTNDYWNWMFKTCQMIYELTDDGGALYFMQREKNVSQLIQIIETSGWTFQNLIIWKKKTSAVPQPLRYGKQYQVIVFATKGEKPRIFNRLRVDLPLERHQKVLREKGVYVTDVWDDIWELTAGYFAGNEAIRDAKTGNRVHEQQSPVALLLRILLSSTKSGDFVLDPFAGTGTTGIVAKQLFRHSINVENGKINCNVMMNRFSKVRKCDNINQYYNYYRFTPQIENIWQRSMLSRSTIDYYIKR